MNAAELTGPPVRFDANGLCQELREYWVLTQARVEPPAGWGT